MMRQVRLKVNAYEKALVFKNGQLVRVLDQGKYWISPWVRVMKYDITELFYHEIDLDLLLQCEDLSKRINVVEVADNEIALQYKNGNFQKVLPSGQYAYWKDGLDYDYEKIALDQVEVSESINRKVLAKPEVARYLSTHYIESYERGLLYVEGKLVKTLDPGVYYYWKNEQNAIVSKVDLRAQQMEISGQELLTSDKATVRLSLFAQYRVTDIVKALNENKDYVKQLYVMIQLALREYLGQYSLDQLLANKSGIAPFVLDFVSDKIANLGVELMDIGVRDIILPGDIREIMNQVLVAEKKAQANTVLRREETASTRSLLNTAKLMEDNEMLFKLKEMEYMEKIADKIGEITINGGGRVIDQLGELLSSR
ncbi:MAG TPA: slipin family protein [Saprospiraceae bacterium]|nr:slipin family protein [Saprospiraceae bacterium]